MEQKSLVLQILGLQQKLAEIATASHGTSLVFSFRFICSLTGAMLLQELDAAHTELARLGQERRDLVIDRSILPLLLNRRTIFYLV